MTATQEMVAREASKEAQAKTTSQPDVAIVVPTYCERDNIEPLTTRIAAMADEAGLNVEVLLMDDKSSDGSVEVVNKLDEPWLTMVEREGTRGLSPAVLEGMERARAPRIVVMDADLSHPPEAIPAMLTELDDGADFVIGSRYVPGGATAEDWGFFRLLNSKAATLLSRPFTSAQDPMAGFFAIKREVFQRAEKLDPIGFKIGLELMVKCNCTDVREVPIHFAQRNAGESKLGIKEQWKYVLHLRRLAQYRWAVRTSAIQFALVGGSGVIVNLGVVTIAVLLGAPNLLAIAFGLVFSFLSNFVLNTAITFNDAAPLSLPKRFVGFIGACGIGAGLNFATAWILLAAIPSLAVQLAALAGIAVGMTANFIGCRFIVYKRS